MRWRLLRPLAVTAVLIVVGLAPTLGFAAPGDTPLGVGVTATGTLSATPTAGYYVADYTVSLKAGQTLCATFTPSAAMTSPAMSMWAPFATPLPPLSRNLDGQDSAWPEALYILAQRTGGYHLRLLGRTADATFTIETAVVTPMTFRFASLGAPGHVVPNLGFSVKTTLVGRFDQVADPVAFVVQRKVKNRWKRYATVGSLSDYEGLGATESVPFHASLKLPHGTFRVRPVFSDAAHQAAMGGAWVNIAADIVLTKLPRGMQPRAALRTYLRDIQRQRYRAAYSLLPRAKQKAYGSAAEFASEVSLYGFGNFRMGPSVTRGSEVVIVSQQSTPAMDINYTWTYVRIGGSWFVRSRVIGGDL